MLVNLRRRPVDGDDREGGGGCTAIRRVNAKQRVKVTVPANGPVNQNGSTAHPQPPEERRRWPGQTVADEQTATHSSHPTFREPDVGRSRGMEPMLVHAIRSQRGGCFSFLRSDFLAGIPENLRTTIDSL